MNYSELSGTALIETVARLAARIRERFPEAGLARVGEELHRITARHAARSLEILRPRWGLRLAGWLLLVACIATLSLLLASTRQHQGDWRLEDAVATLESGLSMLFFLGATAIYVTSLELRSKRRRCLQALHELRALAHIVDLHQLTKDPDRVLHPGDNTASSPERELTPFLLTRYLDYCSEMLSLIGKVAALYAQSFPDPQAVDAVDSIEDLTTGLSRKIWQKIMILSSHSPTGS